MHGCSGSSGQIRGLAQVLAFYGQQTACFTYDDCARLADSATELRRAIDRLVAQARAPQITIIGHSQGALFAHKSLTLYRFFRAGGQIRASAVARALSSRGLLLMQTLIVCLFTIATW